MSPRPLALLLLPLVTVLACKKDDPAKGGGDGVTDTSDTGAAEVELQPVLLDLSPRYGAAGQVVAIQADGLGDAPDAVEVHLDGEPIELGGIEDDVITATIPADASTGDVRVVVDGVESNPAPFVVTDLRISDLDAGAITVARSGTAYATDRLVARWDGTSLEEVEAMVATEGMEVIGWLPSIGLAQIGLGDLELREAGFALERLEADLAMFDYMARPEQAVGGDTDVEALAEEDPDAAWGWTVTHASEAWELGNTYFGSEITTVPVRVGVADLGVDFDHAEFAPYHSTDPEENPAVLGLSVDADDLAADADSHGTAVTSILAGAWNGLGAQGLLSGIPALEASVTVSAEGRIEDFRAEGIEDLAGDGSLGSIFGELANAELLAEMPDTRVVLLPYGLQADDSWTDTRAPFHCEIAVVPPEVIDDLQDLYRDLMHAHPDVLFVASAGNASSWARDHVPGGTPDVDNLLTVGAMMPDGDGVKRWAMDVDDPDCGETVRVGTNIGGTVDLVAPGYQIWIPDPASGAEAFHYGSGTSLAASFVAAVATATASIDGIGVDGASLKSLVVSSGLPLEDDAEWDIMTEPLLWLPWVETGRYLDAAAGLTFGMYYFSTGAPEPQGGSVNGITFGGIDEDGLASLRFNVTVTDLDGQPVDDSLDPSDFSVENMQVVLAEDAGRIDVTVDDVLVTALEYRETDAERVVVPIGIDQSCSMEDNDPDELRLDATRVLFDELLADGSGNEAALASFPRNEFLGDGFSDTDLWQDFTDNGDVLDLALASFPYADYCNGTPIWDSIVELSAHTADYVASSGGDAAAAMVVMTDGEDTTSDLGSWQALEASLEADVPLYLVGLGTDLDFDDLYSLADGSGGTFVVADDPDELDGLFSSMAAAVDGSVSLDVEAGMVPEGGTWVENDLYEVSGQLVYTVPDSGETAVQVVMPFRFDIWLGNL